MQAAEELTACLIGVLSSLAPTLDQLIIPNKRCVIPIIYVSLQPKYLDLVLPGGLLAVYGGCDLPRENFSAGDSTAVTTHGRYLAAASHRC
ncbi:unnamed protein product [Caretta caretta]